MREGDWKLIVDHPSGPNELYDMRNDPHEKQNVASQHPGHVAKLTALLQQQAKLDN